MTDAAAAVTEVGDRVGAFCLHGRFAVAGAETGPLAGLGFAAKDLFDVAGHVTGAGNPCWLATHAPAAATAPSVQALLDAGATLIGKTITDELAYSLNGDNRHYGTPVNVNAAGRVPGGSSSGSAAAVAAGLCDFALATDSGGSIRVPASFCGIYGIRTTHGRIAMRGVVPLMPSYDTIGWLARDAARLAEIGAVLLGRAGKTGACLRRILRLDDAFAEAAPAALAVFKDAETRLMDLFAARGAISLAPAGLEAWRTAFRTHSAAEAWRVHGDWIASAKPDFAPAIAQRFAWAAAVSANDAAAAGETVRAIAAEIRAAVGDDTCLVLPSTPGPAPRIDAAEADVELFRQGTQRLTCIASIAGLPQISIPAGTVDGCPVGLSVIGPPNADLPLLELCAASL